MEYYTKFCAKMDNRRKIVVKSSSKCKILLRLVLEIAGRD